MNTYITPEDPDISERLRKHLKKHGIKKMRRMTCKDCGEEVELLSWHYGAGNIICPQLRYNI